MSETVQLFEMGPRDGLQNEKTMVSSEDKIHLVNLLSDCGFSKIEVTSFVSPKWVPQMADASEVLAGINRKDGVSYAALTPNFKGFERAKDARVNEIAIFASASESFSQKNINCSIEQSIVRFKPVIDAAKAASIAVRGYVSCVVECPYEGAVAPEAVSFVAEKLLELGCYEVSLGDTIGKGTPASIAKMLDQVLLHIPADKLAGHYHDTGGQALENIRISLERGLRTFDAAVGGLGGCPYAPGAKGNVATGKVVELLHHLGYETGIDLDKLLLAEQFINSVLQGDA
jgi:hydroxymethylglutaryl-CoA lyase